MRQGCLFPASSLASLAVIVALSAASCRDAGPGGGDTDDTDDADSGCAVSLDGADGPLFEQTNSRLALTGDQTYLEFTGALYDGPAISFHQEAEREGLCRLLTYEAASCDPPCGGGDVCVDGDCAEYPSTLSAGTMELLGVASDPIVMEADVTGHYYWSGGGGVQDVDLARIEASGGAAPGFELAACMVGPPQADGDWSAALEDRPSGEDVVLAWSNPIDTARVYLRMTTGIGTHGGISPVEIECEGPDTGSLTLPGAFLDQLYAPGYWSCGECGDNRLLRYHAVETEAGSITVQLRTQAPASFWFRP